MEKTKKQKTKKSLAICTEMIINVYVQMNRESSTIWKYKSTTEENYSFRVALKVSQQKKYKNLLKKVQKWL